MSRIECSNCGDMIEVTASTVVLPFTCMKCDTPCDTPDEFAGQVYDDMAPTNRETFTDEFATVENTTALIADLEKQLADTKAFLNRRDRESTVLLARIMGLEDLLVAAGKDNEVLLRSVDSLHRQIMQLRLKAANDEEVMTSRLAEKTEQLEISRMDVSCWIDAYLRLARFLAVPDPKLAYISEAIGIRSTLR